MTLLQRCLNRLVQQSQSAAFSDAICNRRRGRSVDTYASYQSLEPRKLLAVLTVDTLADVTGPSDLNDGLVSLREAITAANTNTAFGDAPAGDATGDSINFASSLSGQTITLGGSELAIEDDLIIRGNNNITLRGGDESRILRITTAENVTLSRLGFVDGQADDGGALLAEGGGTVRLFESQFSSNAVTGDGGAVFNRGSRLLIFGSSFTDNAAENSGGAVFFEGGSTNTTSSIFSGNTSEVDGGAIATDGGELFFFDATIEQNSSVNISDKGGGLYLGGTNSSALFLRSNINENSAGNGGGIYLEAENRLTIFGDTVISGNTAFEPGSFDDDGSGGGIFSNGIVRIGSSEISGNSSVQRGGGIYSVNGILNVTNSDILNNQTEDDGGGVAALGTRLILQGVTFRSNATTGVRDIPSQISSGGALYVADFDRFALPASTDPAEVDTQSIVTILGSTFQFNSSFDIGGAIFNSASITTIGSSFIGGNEALGADIGAFGGGGGIHNVGDQLTISSTTIQNNRSFQSSSNAGIGGGVYSSSSLDIGNRGILNINFSSVLRNQAQVRGGGIAIEGGTATLFETNVGNLEGDGNRAGSTNDGSADLSSERFGGGISVFTFSDAFPFDPITNPQAKLTIFGGVIANNVANDSGGGLFSRNSEVILRAAFGEESPVFSANRALVRDGGGVYATGGTLLLRDAFFENNSSRNGGGIFATDNTEGERFDSSVLGTNINLDRSVVQSNNARRSGGGLFLDEGIDVDLSDATVEGNDALFGPDVLEV